MAFNFGAYYLTNWSPTYYKDVLGLSPTLRRTDGDKTLHLRPRIEWNRARARVDVPAVRGAPL